MFAHSLRKYNVRDWSIEQKWVSVLLPLLLLYNGIDRAFMLIGAKFQKINKIVQFIGRNVIIFKHTEIRLLYNNNL